MSYGRREVTLEALQAHALGAYGDLTSDLMNLIDTQVAAIKVDSTFGPPIYIPDPFRKESSDAASGGPAPTVTPGEGFDVARMLKPKMTFVMRDGSTKSYAPYGDPGENHWGIVLAVGIGVLALATYGGIEASKKVRRK